MDTILTFDSIPRVISEINRKLDILLSEREDKTDDKDYLMTLEKLLEYLPEKPARGTIYQWVNHRKIPFEKYGKRLYFRKFDIDNWINKGRVI